MPRYKLLKPHYLGDKNQQRYYSEGTVIDFDGPPSLHMQPLDAAAKSASDERRRDLPREKRRMSASERQLRARIVPQPGGAPPDSTWAPQPRPAFSVLMERPEETKTPSDQSDVVRVAASAPSAGGATPSTDAALAESETDAAAAADAKGRKPARRRGGRKAKAK